jgi:ATP adenylyltransferase
VRQERLRSRLEEVSRRALRSGALEPIATRTRFLEDASVRFVVRIVERIERKQASLAAQEKSGRNPFLPYERELFVADISGTHVAVLNKFNVLENHLLVVTRAFEEQESLLTAEDFEAMRAVLEDFDSLFFYNAGASAGASQRHKHLQFVPVPLGEGPERCPMEVLLARGREALPFPCDFEAAPPTRERYLDALAAFGRTDEPRDYNLLATREWMLLVPRRRGSFESISVNGLGFAGAFLVRNDEELERLSRAGPMTVLREVALR